MSLALSLWVISRRTSLRLILYETFLNNGTSTGASILRNNFKERAMAVRCWPVSLLIYAGLRPCFELAKMIAISLADIVFAVAIVVVGVLGDDASHRPPQWPYCISNRLIQRVFNCQGTSLKLHAMPISQVPKYFVHFEINTSGVGARGIFLVARIILSGNVLILIRFLFLCVSICAAI